MQEDRPKILYYASWNSFTHVGSAYNLAKRMPNVDFHVVTAEKWPFEPLKNLFFHKLYRPNCAMRIDDKFYLHTYPYEKELGDIKRYRRHFLGYIRLLEKIDPNLVLVDVTLEIAIWTKFLGYPVALFYETYDSSNLRHGLAWDNVDMILARYPRNFVEQIETNINSKMVFIGGVSKFDSLDRVPTKEESAKKIGLKKDKRKIITILSSSHSYNMPQIRNYFETICEAANSMASIAQVFMLYPQNDRLAKTLKKKYKNINFIIGVFDLVHHYLNLSDLVITGAGMGATMESAFFRCPMLMIPVPWSINEQMLKASALEKIGVAKVINPVDMTPEMIRDSIDQIFADKQMVTTMKEASTQLINRKGYNKLASVLNKLLKTSSAISKSSVLND